MLMEVSILSHVADVFKALGDPTRIRIVEMLAENGEMCVCRIMEELGMIQSAVSHHLAKLRYAGLVRSRRQGQWMHYSLSRAALSDVALAFLQDLVRRSDKAPARAEECLSPGREGRGR
jgi:ArsR family transcriptional regulator